MTGTITFNDDLTFNEIEWRSHAVLADAGHTIVRVAKQSRIAQRTQREFLYGKILMSVRSVAGLMRDLLSIFHAPDAILALESATPEQLSHLAATMRDVHGKVEQTLAMIHPPRRWRTLYRPSLEKLKAYNDELDSHARAFAATDSGLMLLSKKDQDQLAESLLNPPGPTAALRRAFVRK